MLETSVSVFCFDSNHKYTVGSRRLIIAWCFANYPICISIFIYFHGLLKVRCFVFRQVLKLEIFSFGKCFDLWKILQLFSFAIWMQQIVTILFVNLHVFQFYSDFLFSGFCLSVQIIYDSGYYPHLRRLVITTCHRKCFSTSCLPIGKYCAIVSLNRRLD